MRTSLIGLVAVLLIAAPLSLSIPIVSGSAQTTSITVNLNGASGDTFILEVTAQEDLTLASNGHVALTGDFPQDEKLQRISALVSTARDDEIECGEVSSTFVGNGNAGVRTGVQGAGPCFMGLYGNQVDDISASTDPDQIGDVRVMGGPGLQAEAQYEYSAHDTLTIGVVYGEGTVFPLPDGANEATYHFIITVPEATTLENPGSELGSAVELEFEGSISGYTSQVQEAGFSIWPDEMEPVGAQAPFLSAYYSHPFVCGSGCGQTTENLQGDAVYAAMGHTWGGHNTIHNPANDGTCGDCLFVPTVASGWYGYFGPGVSAFTANAALSTGDALAPLVTVVGAPPGDYTFWVDYYLGTGNQDLLTVGLAGDLP